ncbi:histidine kinase dimerization/phosphoacceptor domain-containing protein, partial [Streptomyces sp. NPDC002265]|uniref:sensor histidine kinase n=1 Tax=Streptomyces sp. NPDC002265 TaxID=3154415 RepID=UPI003326CB91
MARLLRPFGRVVTYTRLLHLFIAIVWPSLWLFVEEAWWTWVAAAAVLVPVGLVPAMRTVEGLQARLLLTAHGHDGKGTGIVVAPSASWGDRARLVLWLEARLLLGCATALSFARLLLTSVDLVLSVLGRDAGEGALPFLDGRSPWHLLLLPPVLVALAVTVVVPGRVVSALAPRLLGPSPAERLAALEERTEQLLERNRIARELHDSIGHALTVAVVQAGAARAAGDPAFTDRALGAIEETGRAALDDLERVLGVLRESERPVGSRPTLTDARRGLDTARGCGAEVDAQHSGPRDTQPR